MGIDEKTMRELKRQVERVVRGISANYGRKDQMREELAAHLTGLYEEELEARGEAAAALARTLARFGSARELRRELQASVPPMERVIFFQFPLPRRLCRAEVFKRFRAFMGTYHFKRPGESALGHAGRLTRYLGFVLAAFYVPVLAANLIARLASGRPLERFYFGAMVAGAMAASILLVCFLLVLIGHGLHRALDEWFEGRGSLLAVVGHGALSSLAVLAAGLLFWALALGNLKPDMGDLYRLVGVAAATPVAVTLMVRLGIAEFRRFGDWGDMELED